MNFGLLLTTYPEWMTTSFPIIRMIIMALVTICAVTCVIIILSMESNPDGGTNVISGVTESFYSKNKGSTKEGRLKKAIIVSGITLVVLTILYFVTYLILPL